MTDTTPQGWRSRWTAKSAPTEAQAPAEAAPLAPPAWFPTQQPNPDDDLGEEGDDEDVADQ